MRIENWPSALIEFMEVRRATPFQWGVSDCCLFAADAVQAITGEDFAVHWRGKYSDARGALEFIDEAGGVANLIPHEFERIDPAFAQRGDVVLMKSDGRDVLGINLGGLLVGQGPDGLTFLPYDEALLAWKTAR